MATLGNFGKLLAVSIANSCLILAALPSDSRGELRTLSGNLLRTAPPPHRIVSLSPNLTELITALGEGEKIRGITRFCSLPGPNAEIVGDLLRIDYEKILKIQPDFVVALASGAQRRQVERVEQLGLPVAVMHIESIGEWRVAVADLGKLLRRDAEAKILSDSVPLAPTTRSGPPRRALLLTSSRPIFGSSDQTFEGDLLRMAGYENVLSGPSLQRRPKLSPEQLLVLNPDWIFVAEHTGEREFLRSPLFSSLQAVRSRRVFAVNPDLILKAGRSVAAGLKEFER